MDEYWNRFRPAKLAGRCINGAERDGGKVVHISHGQWRTALCGARPGRQSAGFFPVEGDPTCRRCLHRSRDWTPKARRGEHEDCSWCGGETFRPYRNTLGEMFCSKNHRDASNKARREFLAAPGTRSPEELFIEHAHDGERHPREGE